MAGLLVVVFALPGLWQAFHLLAVPHFECPYDGALVHEHELPDEPPKTRSEADDENRQVAVVPQHDHANCRESCWGHSKAVLLPFVRELAATVAWLPQLEPIPQGRVFASDVLSYAPKLPPPVMASRA
jgi:hypothetical protein